ncbi:hypothetical protein [Saccharopolyspora shandongensis]|uniref:Uncharacterized protein n=1 Tax=Saccharopolyspora shandongensis TaxID=418495 RepID=A0A1H3M5K0_9PSEU|nr:hypothetical protein [Saccharopolyspora shandongensis]SDY71574.1 hypothetical protein SAMN05216215_103352 [Saccharopolyspora shandongensis]
MSAPGIGKESHISLPDFGSVAKLPKPIKALVYLIMLSVLTVAGIGALMATIAVIGQLTGAFDVFSFFG